MKALSVCMKGIDADCMTLNMRADKLSNQNSHIQRQLAMMRKDIRGKLVGNVPLLSLEVLNLEEKFLVAYAAPWLQCAELPLVACLDQLTRLKDATLLWQSP
jgi:hypothetical protein